MIKGVSKQILEVTNTDNPYFDKIIFFVKPEHQSTDRKKLQKEAEAVAERLKERIGNAVLKTDQYLKEKLHFYPCFLQWQGAVLHLLLHY